MSLPTVWLGTDGKTPAQVACFPFFSAQAKEASKEGQKTVGGYLAPEPAGKKFPELAAILEYLGQSKHFSGKKLEVSLLRGFKSQGAANIALVGLGSKEAFTTDMARQTGAAIFHLQKREKLSRASVSLAAVTAANKPSEKLVAFQAFCEGYWLASYEFSDFKKGDPSAFHPEGLELLDAKGKEFEKGLQKARLLVDATFFARQLGDKPGNSLTPKEFTRLTQAMAKSRGLGFKALGAKEMEKEGMGLLLGVAQGSAEEPQLIVMEYLGGKKSDRPIALVGKGVTFDSGGISLKPADRMEEMKYDMMGAATVAAVMQVIADLKLKVNVTGYIAATENMPDGRAQKPGDIQKSLSGKTVEIINTDAEGRLILADALEYAQKTNPQAIIDFATLTGAVVVALGTVTTGIMGTHPGLVQAMKVSSKATDERVWELPLYEEYEEDLKSHYADIKNSGGREAGSSKGGTFLKFFIDKKYPWVHVDMAGSSYHRKDRNYFSPRNGSGSLVRLMAHLLENWQTPKG